MDMTAPALPARTGLRGFLDRINNEAHERALQIFLVIVLAHWSEHLAQATQIYLLGWPVKKAGGVLGLFFPWLLKSETLHYGYALVMVAVLWLLRRGFKGRAYTWWMIAFWIQFWHHIEHIILQMQAIIGHNFFGSPVPSSVVQIWVPRVELHLFYNGAVFLPMVVAMYYHMFPTPEEEAQHNCSCAWKPRVAAGTTTTRTA